MSNSLLADATTITGLSDTGQSGLDTVGTSWVGLAMALIICLVLLVAAILLIPRFFDKMLNIGPIMGIVALVGAGIAFPYAVNLALTPTRTSTSASADINVGDIEFLPTTNGMLTIRWTTNKAALSAVRYGIKETVLDKAAFPEDPGTKKTNHEAVIVGLESGKKYYFEIIIGEKRFNKDGKPLEYLMP